MTPALAAAVKNISTAAGNSLDSVTEMMTNREISQTLIGMAGLLEIKKGNHFKVRAYLKAADTISGLQAEVAQFVREGRFRDLPGIGPVIQRKVLEILDTGKLNAYETLKTEFPFGIPALLAVPGISARTVRRLYLESHITSPQELKDTLDQGKPLPPLGKMTPAEVGSLLETIMSGDGAQ
jgi:DNA polymerase/3'-5' exonuclease PolX